MAKVLFYLENGIRLIWIVSPKTRSVTVYRSNNAGNFLRESDTLEGEDVLPNFRLSVAALFADLPKQ